MQRKSLETWLKNNGFHTGQSKELTFDCEVYYDYWYKDYAGAFIKIPVHSTTVVFKDYITDLGRLTYKELEANLSVYRV